MCPIGQKCAKGYCVGASPPPPASFQKIPDKACTSALSCQRLSKAYKGWPVSKKMRTSCGESDNGFHSSGKKCFGGQNSKIANTDGWAHAENICYEAGGRLCTSAELSAGVPMHTGCGHDGQRVWSSTACISRGGAGHISMVATGKAQCSKGNTDHAVRCCADASVGKNKCDPFAAGEVKAKQCSSAKTCKQLAQIANSKHAWPSKRGDSKVCGESDDGLGPNHKRQCYGRAGQQVSWAQAEHVCIGAGARMCTVEELEADETRGTGCSHDRTHVWSADTVDCKPGWHVGVVGSSGTKKKSKCIQDSGSAAVRCCADTTVTVACKATSAPPPPIKGGQQSKKCGKDPNNPFGGNIKCPRGQKCVAKKCKRAGGGGSKTVYIINSQGQCGEATFPSKWTTAALKWVGTQGLKAKVGTCASLGYTQPAGSKTLRNTGAPSNPVVKLYTKGNGGGKLVHVYYISHDNNHGYGPTCGEAAFPSSWASRALAWVKSQKVRVIQGTCSAQGYTMSAGTKTIGNTGAPSPIKVRLYNKGLAPPSPPSPPSGTVTVSIVNVRTFTCGESTIPTKWGPSAMKWIGTWVQGTPRTMSCSAQGYTQRGARQVVQGTNAPSAVYVTLYTKSKGPEKNYVAPVTMQMSSSARGHTTVRLGLKLSSGAKNVYTMYGDKTSAMMLPPAYQVPGAFGANIGGVNPQFAKFKPEAAFDSWLTMGLTTGDTGNTISSIGINWKAWNDAVGIHTSNGAIFCMDPNKGPTARTVMVAQLTVKRGLSKAIASFGGRAAGGADWHQHNVVFKW